MQLPVRRSEKEVCCTVRLLSIKNIPILFCYMMSELNLVTLTQLHCANQLSNSDYWSTIILCSYFHVKGLNWNLYSLLLLCPFYPGAQSVSALCLVGHWGKPSEHRLLCLNESCDPISSIMWCGWDSQSCFEGRLCLGFNHSVIKITNLTSHKVRGCVGVLLPHSSCMVWSSIQDIIFLQWCWWFCGW